MSELFKDTNKPDEPVALLPRSFRMPGGSVTNLRNKWKNGTITEEALELLGFVKYITPEPVPETIEEIRARMVVSPWRLRKALNRTGTKRNEVENLVKQLDQDSQDGWEYATSFERLNPLVVSMVATLGMTEEEADDLFILAATL